MFKNLITNNLVE